MGYTTEFYGAIDIEPKVTDEFRDRFNSFTNDRHMTLSYSTIEKYDENPDSHTVDGKPVACSCWNWYFVPTDDCKEINYHDAVDYDCPQDLPDVYCDWTITDDSELVWNGNEKSYYMYAWLDILIDRVFKPKGYTLNGEVEFQGEEPDDEGTFYVNDNVVGGDEPWR